MNKFGKGSELRKKECHPDLIRLLDEAIKSGPDFSIICGHRSKNEQDEAFKKGYTKLKWPNSEHNSFPSKAVDIVPYPVDWKDEKRFLELAKHIFDIARKLEISVIWGGNWDDSYYEPNKSKNSFIDMPHWQLSGVDK